MTLDTIVDQMSGRQCYRDFPADLGADEEVTFLLNLAGGRSVGAWQREYFPANDDLDAGLGQGQEPGSGLPRATTGSLEGSP